MQGTTTLNILHSGWAKLEA